MITGVVLAGLAVMWAGVLGWEWVEHLREGGGRRRDPITSFRSQLHTLGRTSGVRAPARTPGHRSLSRASELGTVGGAMPLNGAEAARRRRDVASLLIAGSVITVLGWLTTRSVLALALALVVVGLTATYGYLLLRRQRLIAERALKVTYLQRGTTPAPARASYRRSAN